MGAPSVGENRDDFAPQTKDLLAKRSGFICSFPGCRRLTIGPSADRASRVSLVGVAAHICAASRGGPRYDENQSREERSSEANGIWMCQTHAKLIDDNASRHTAQEIRRWKKQHEEWVFGRISAGEHRLDCGMVYVKAKSVGIFNQEERAVLGRHNVIAGLNESGKTTLCQIISAFSGGLHYKWFADRFGFCCGADGAPLIEVGVNAGGVHYSIKLSQQISNVGKRKKQNLQRLHIEVNGGISADWPRHLFRVLHFDGQLYSMRGGLKDTFREAIRYLARIFSVGEDLIWDCMRDEVFATSVFGYKFRRVAKYRIEVLVPDGRSFYLPTSILSHTEKSFVILDVALKMALASKASTPWLFIVDTGFFARLDDKHKSMLFEKMMSIDSDGVQSIVCVNDGEDAEMLKEYRSDNWFNASAFGGVTVHAFL